MIAQKLSMHVVDFVVAKIVVREHHISKNGLDMIYAEHCGLYTFVRIIEKLIHMEDYRSAYRFWYGLERQRNEFLDLCDGLIE